MNGNISKDEEQVQESYFHANFTSPGSTVFSMEMKSILPGQLLALAGTLEVLAKANIMEEQNRQRREQMENKLTVPNSKIETVK